MSDMIKTNARNFARNFSEYRAAAARGETVRIAAPDGVFLLTREKAGLTGTGLLAKLSKLPPGGFLGKDGGRRILEGKRRKILARSPWEK
jgi:hypothetical protein